MVSDTQLPRASVAIRKWRADQPRQRSLGRRERTQMRIERGRRKPVVHSESAECVCGIAGRASPHFEFNIDALLQQNVDALAQCIAMFGE